MAHSQWRLSEHAEPSRSHQEEAKAKVARVAQAARAGAGCESGLSIAEPLAAPAARRASPSP